MEYRVLQAVSESLDAVVDCLRRDGVVLVPTDTVYGLACRMGNPEGLARIRAIKQHAVPRPYALLLADAAQAAALWDAEAREAVRLAELSWPGPVTIIGVQSSQVPPHVVVGNSVGLRVPDQDFVRQMIRNLGEPLIATSANLTGQPSPQSFSEVDSAILEKVDLAVTAGVIESGGASKVIDATYDPPRILRT